MEHLKKINMKNIKKLFKKEIPIVYTMENCNYCAKLKGQLMDNIDMKWETEHGDCQITNKSIEWIMKNVNTSKYNTERCYVYNKAFARWFDNSRLWA